MSEELYELPTGWVWTSIKEIGEVITGTTPSKSNAEYYGRDFPFFKPTDLNKGYYVREAEDGLSKEGIQKARLIPEKSILVTCIGATISKTGFIRVQGSCNQQINAIVPNINLLPEFIYFWCISPFFKKTVIAHASSTTLPILNKSKFETLSFPFPPLPEQYRIVAKIEEIFTELDAGVELLKKLKVKLKRYRQAVLKAAVEGSLTQEWREANQGKLEPASVLLERILKQRREKWEAEQLAKMKAQGKTPKDDSWKLKYKEPVAPDTSELPELPDGWCWATPEQLASTNNYSLGIGPFGSDLKVEDYRDKGFPLVFVKNIRSGIFGDENTKYVTFEKAQTLFAHQVEGGDILITKMGAPPGDACLYPLTRPPAIITADCIKWKISEIIYNKLFFVYIINSRIIQTQISQITKGVAQQKVSLTRFKGISVPLPPLKEQNYISEEIERLFSVTNQLEKTIDTNLKRSEKLRQSILKQAFQGKLVPQDSNDEPAEKLLERIKAEKAKQTTTKTKKKTQSKTQSNLQLELPLK